LPLRKKSFGDFAPGNEVCRQWSPCSIRTSRGSYRLLARGQIQRDTKPIEDPLEFSWAVRSQRLVADFAVPLTACDPLSAFNAGHPQAGCGNCVSRCPVCPRFARSQQRRGGIARIAHHVQEMRLRENSLNEFSFQRMLWALLGHYFGSRTARRDFLNDEARGPTAHFQEFLLGKKPAQASLALKADARPVMFMPPLSSKMVQVVGEDLRFWGGSNVGMPRQKQ
jgi:ferredoxin